jgi:23S rRNA pseudouridine2457 synthase
LFLGEIPHERTYLVQLNNKISLQNLELLRNGVSFKIKDGVDYTTAPCTVVEVTDPSSYCNMGARLTAYPPYTWLLITITEGKYHQVRKMIAAIRHKCKRLIRVSIEDLELGDIPPGGVKEMDEDNFFRLLKISTNKISL